MLKGQNKYPRRVARAVPILLLIWISGCTSTATDITLQQTSLEPEESIADASKTDAAETSTVNASASGLTDQLLYDVLLASIAGQRQQPEVALEALSRAVYLSRNRRLTSNAIQLALQLKDYQKTIQFSRLLLTQDPDNHRVGLALASAQINSDKLEEAGETLVDLVVKQPWGNEAVLQQVAGLISRQPEEIQTRLQDILLQATSNDNPQLVFTAAMVASFLEQNQQFSELLDRTLSLQPDWEVPAMMKLTQISEQENAESDVADWAEAFLENHPESQRFRTQYARLLIRQDKLEQAAQQLDNVLKQDPEDQDALFAGAVVNMDLRKFDRAERLFTRYIETSSNADQARLYLAQMFIEAERFDEASPLLRQIQSSQYYLDAQIALSGVIAKLSNVDAGLSHLRNIDVRGEEETVRIILEQDSLLRTFDQMNRSLELLTAALIERPQQPDLLYSRGLLAAQLNQIDLIEKDMRQLIELQPDNAHAYNALGYTLADQTERFDEALTLIRKALEFRPEDPFILDSMGWVHYRIGKIDEALEYLERALELKPDAEIAAHLGEVLWISGNKKQAKKVWQQGKELGPENTTLLKTIDRFLDGHKDQQAVLNIPPPHPGLLAAFFSSRIISSPAV